jgi:hypothetical protein
MAGTVVVDTINSSVAGTPTVFQANGTQIGTLCRAWVNFNGTGTVAIRGSFNVSSITDNGTGNYTVNFTNAMPDANYAFTIGAGQLNIDNVQYASIHASNANGTATLKSTTQLQIATGRTSTATLTDNAEVNIAIFR